MCGIVGYVGHRKARALLLAGLEKLEYRGYDSAGISVLEGDRIDAVRAVGNLSALRGGDRGGRRGTRRRAGGGGRAPQPATGIGHTRWATHGRVTEENAHPHFDTADRIHIVVNGIVENYVELKERLIRAAPRSRPRRMPRSSRIGRRHYNGDLVEAVRRADRDARHYAFVAMSADSRACWSARVRSVL